MVEHSIVILQLHESHWPQRSFAASIGVSRANASWMPMGTAP